MFNDYVWKNYLDGKGKDVVSSFEKNYTGEFTKEYVERICDLHKAYCPSKSINERIREELLSVNNDLKEGFFFEEGYYTIDSALKYFYELFIKECDLTAQGFFDLFSESVAYYTTFISLELPELFVPYYFQWNFNIFEMIAQEFEIDLPEMPIKKDYKGRFMYYGEICEALYEFRIKHNMSPYELYAFLYDFAPKYVGGIDSYIIKDLP